MPSRLGLTIDRNDADDDYDVIVPTVDHVPKYNNNCNRTFSLHGFGELCALGLNHERLMKNGWQLKDTGGANSVIYVHTPSYLKISKGPSARLDTLAFCQRANNHIRKIRSLKEKLGSFAPRIHYLQVCGWNESPHLIMMMNDAGIVNKNIPDVTDKHITAAAFEMVHSGVYSYDLYTRDGRMNTGNIAFRLTPKKKKLNVMFLDLDDVSQYQDTTNVPAHDLLYLWKFIIYKCLRRPTEELDLRRFYHMSQRFVPLISDDDA